jgi:hypothetical protein
MCGLSEEACDGFGAAPLKEEEAVPGPAGMCTDKPPDRSPKIFVRMFGAPKRFQKYLV